jgi:bifunctional non-homologous end joining protein LigD
VCPGKVRWQARVAAENGGAVQGINRKGLLIGLLAALVSAAGMFKGDFVIDGECIGDELHVFDLLMRNNDDWREQAYSRRAAELMNVLGSGNQRHIHFAETAWKRREKAAMLDGLRGQKKEGIIFKRLDACYTPGRPNSGGTQLKHKFYAMCSAVVARLNPQRSVELRLLNGNGWVARRSAF